MNDEHDPPRVDVVRGLITAAIGGGIAQATVFLLLFCLALVRWLTSDLVNPSLLRYVEELPWESFIPFLGGIVIGACSGWTAFAPHGKHSAAFTLVKLFLLTIDQWVVAGSLGLAPGRRHALPTVGYDIYTIAYAIIPMLFASIGLTIYRANAADPTRSL